MLTGRQMPPAWAVFMARTVKYMHTVVAKIDDKEPATTIGGDGIGLFDQTLRNLTAKDGIFEREDLRGHAKGARRRFDCDIVFANGEFAAYPEGD